MRQRQSELTEGRGERLRLRHTAETGIKELESEERGSLIFLFMCVRDTVPIIRCVFVHMHSLPWCQNIPPACYRGNKRVQDKKHVVPKEQAVRADSL